MAAPTSSSALTTPSHASLHNARVDLRMFHTNSASTDITTSLASAISAMSAGETLYIPSTSAGWTITDTITVNKSIAIVSDGAKITQTGTGKKGLYITASGVTIDGLYLYGRQSSTAVSSEHAIHITGTDINGYLSNVNVRNCRIENWGFYGILAEFTKHFDFSHNRIIDVVYAGISGLSVFYGRIANNDVDMDGTTGSSGNAYGITVSHNTPSNEADVTNHPLASDIVITGNLVQNNTLWEGIDTHGGYRIVVSNNQVYNCKVGIALVPADDFGGTEYWGPQEFTIIGNTVDSTRSDGAAGSAEYGGIVVKGAGSGTGTYEELARGSIIGNVVKGHGLESDALSGGIVAYFTEGLTIAGNVVTNCSPAGINLYHTNYGFSVVGNTIIDPWSDSVATAWAIRVTSSDQTGFLAANTARNGDLTGKTHILDRGIDVASSTNIDVRLGVNHLLGATTPVTGTITSGVDEATDGTLRVFSAARVDGALGVGASAPAGVDLAVQTDQNGQTMMQVWNNTDGTAAAALVSVKSSSSSGFIGAGSASYTGGSSLFGDALMFSTNSDAARIVIAAVSSGQDIRFYAGSTTMAAKITARSVVVGAGGALATDATDGFLYIPTCAGTPTGTPTTQSGTVPIVFDTTNNKLYIYDGSWLGGTSPGAFT